MPMVDTKKMLKQVHEVLTVKGPLTIDAIVGELKKSSWMWGGQQHFVEYWMGRDRRFKKTESLWRIK